MVNFELCLDPNANSVQLEIVGIVAYLDIDNIEVECKNFLSIGAKEHREIQDVGENIKVAIVADPFGNLVSIIYNPYFKTKYSHGTKQRISNNPRCREKYK